jgi:hypothetical protein
MLFSTESPKEEIRPDFNRAIMVDFKVGFMNARVSQKLTGKSYPRPPGREENYPLKIRHQGEADCPDY